MHDLRGIVAEAVHAQDLQRLGMEQDLEDARTLVGHLRARQALEMRVADFVGNAGLLQLPLGLAHRRDLRNRVDAAGYQVQPTRWRGWIHDVLA